MSIINLPSGIGHYMSLDSIHYQQANLKGRQGLRVADLVTQQQQKKLDIAQGEPVYSLWKQDLLQVIGEEERETVSCGFVVICEGLNGKGREE